MIPAIINVVVLPPFLALLLSAAVIAMLIRSRASTLALDYPNPRSLHAIPTPRLGGVGIAIGVTVAWSYAAPDLDSRVLIALGMLLAISLLEDFRGVAIAWRLVAHFAAALLAMSAAFEAQPFWTTLVATLATAWMINLYNFMDGADGLAGGMTVIGFGSYGVTALTGGDFSFAAINLSVAAAALGFLLFNFPPARVFMGDVGAIPLGCLSAVFNIAGWLRGDWPWWFGIVIFSPFIMDASLTLLKRLSRGAKIWQAHREHYYQRLVQSGWGHRRTTLAEYALMLVCSGLAITGARQGLLFQFAILGMVALLYAGLVVVLERYFARHA